MSTLLPKLRFRIFIRLTLLYLAVGLLSVVVFKWLLPEAYFSAYPLIGFFFWALGMIFNYQLNRTRFENPNKIAYVYMWFRMAKLLITIAVIAVSGLIIEDYKTSFVISVIANYLIYSIVELYIYYIYNKRLRIRNDHRKLHKG